MVRNKTDDDFLWSVSVTCLMSLWRASRFFILLLKVEYFCLASYLIVTKVNCSSLKYFPPPFLLHVDIIYSKQVQIQKYFKGGGGWVEEKNLKKNYLDKHYKYVYTQISNKYIFVFFPFYYFLYSICFTFENWLLILVTPSGSSTAKQTPTYNHDCFIWKFSLVKVRVRQW